jgi:hypothetical protein
MNLRLISAAFSLIKNSIFFMLVVVYCDFASINWYQSLMISGSLFVVLQSCGYLFICCLLLITMKG